MADMAESIARQGVSIGLNSFQPALFSLGPIGIGLGTVVALFMSLMGGDDTVKMLVKDDGTVTQADDGSPVMVGKFGPFQQWVIQLYSGFVKLARFLADGPLDINDLTLSMEFRQWSNGMWQLDIGYAFDSEQLQFADDDHRGMFEYSYGRAHFDATGVYWRILRAALINNNSDLPAHIRTILRDPAKGDKDAINAAIEARKADLAASKADREALRQRLAELVAQHAELARQQDADLYQQELNYIADQIDEARAALAASEAATAAADKIAQSASRTAAKQKVAAAVPWLFFLGMAA